MTGTAWETVGWKETAAQARDPDKAKEDIKVFLKEFYKKKKKDPRKHQRVVCIVCQLYNTLSWTTGHRVLWKDSGDKKINV